MIRKFLLVDDDQDDTDLFYEALRTIDTSIEVHSSQNCKEIIAKLKHGILSPEIIFLDVNMPEMNGWDCLSILKSDEQLKDIPVVMYSTSSVGRDGPRALTRGAVCYLEKPPSYLKLKEFLQKLTGASSDNLKDELKKIEQSRTYKLLCSAELA